PRFFTVCSRSPLKISQTRANRRNATITFSPLQRPKSNALKTSENQLFSIRSQMLYPVELRAQIVIIPMKLCLLSSELYPIVHKKFRSNIRCINFWRHDSEK